MATRWGIASAGRISNDFVGCLKSQKKEEHQVAAVCARKLDDAHAFATKFDIPKAYGSYQELADDPNLDIIYVGNLNIQHCQTIKMMINAGKHVLSEKPFVMNCKEGREVTQLAKEKGVFFMEGFWSRFFPAYIQLRKELEQQSIGEIRMVRAEFGFPLDHVPRVNDKALGGGSLMDVGPYPVMFVNQIFNEKPLEVKASGILTEKGGVDQAVSISLLYSGNRMATICSSVNVELTNTGTVYGTKGMIKIPTIWCPTSSIVIPAGSGAPGGQAVEPKVHEFALPKVSHKLEFLHGEGMTYEQQHVRECLLKGLKESPIMPWKDSMQIMEILEAARDQIGVVYDADK